MCILESSSNMHNPVIHAADHVHDVGIIHVGIIHVAAALEYAH